MTVNKITAPPTKDEVVDKINEVIDNLGGQGTAPVWGNISGTLSNQTDLQSALNNKYDLSNPNGYTSNVGTVTSVNNVQPVNGNVTLSIPDTSNLANKDLSNLSNTGNNKFQAPLESGINIKTINNNSILGSGNLVLDGLPDQTGYTDAVLLTDGTDASWNETEEIYPVVETYINGTSWYRVYSDGWCEQGGYISSDGTVNLLKTFNSLNYTITFGSSGTNNGVPRETRASRTTSSFAYSSANVASAPANWQACGYIEV